ncbi:MAG: hypothetical protein LBQ60_20135 [Bacteroidales bacterium]|jgi:hypothetical protein|nr:hypothetical protein [Bacteroidales bacterium]
MDEHAFYHADMPLSEVLKTDYRLHMTLSFVGVKLGFCPQATIKEVCALNNVDHNFFLFLGNIYTFDNYSPEHYPESLSFEDSLRYVLKVHDYTQKEIFPHTEQGFASVQNQLSPSDRTQMEETLKSFFSIFNKYHSDFDQVLENYRKTHQSLDATNTQVLLAQIDEIVIRIKRMIEILPDKEECSQFKYFLSFLTIHIAKHEKLMKYALKPMFTYTDVF